MKKRFIILLMICTMLLLVACGKEEGTGSMVVDDVFVITDRGVVLTGNVGSGVICVGDRAVIIREAGTELESEVVEIEWFRKSVDELGEGEYAGIYLDNNIERGDVSRGDKLIVYGE